MLETLQIGDHLLVNKFLYGLRNPFNDDYLIRGVEPKVGDIIVFRYPKDRSLDYIKRIVGVPGDTLEMRNKVLYRNGVEVQEPYTQHSQPLIMIPGRDNWGPITVPGWWASVRAACKPWASQHALTNKDDVPHVWKLVLKDV